MTGTISPLSDAELIAAVRSGDLDAYGDLFGRHRDAATRLARQLVPGPDADDLVAEAFTRVMSVLQAGKGPDEFFRAYVLSSIRRLHIDRLRAGRRVRTTGEEAELDRAIEFIDPAEMKFEQAAAAAAFASLPERWQLVLWHLDVEGEKPAELAGLLGMSPNSVSALAYRAREGLRRAYLQRHLAPPIDDGCRWTTAHLGQHVRRGLSKNDTARVEEHLDTCRRCSTLHLELLEVNSSLGALLAPAILGTAAAGYLGAGASAGVAGSTAGPDRTARPDSGSRTGALLATTAAILAVLIVGAVGVSRVIGNDDPGSSIGAARPGATTPPSQSGGADETPPRPSSSPPTTATPSSLPQIPAPAVPGVPRRILPGPLPSTAIDFRVSLASVDEAPAFQRRIAIATTARAGEAPRGTTLTLSLTFGPRAIYYRGGSTNGWVCDAPAVNRPVRTMTCTRPQTGRDIPPLAVSIFGCVPEVTARISASRNTDATDNSDTLRTGDYGRDTPPSASCAVASTG